MEIKLASPGYFEHQTLVENDLTGFELAPYRDYEANVSSVSPSSELFTFNLAIRPLSLVHLFHTVYIKLT